MADTKISALTAVSAALAAQEVPVNDAGTTKKMTIQQLMTLLGNTVNNVSVASQSPAAGATTKLTNSDIVIPANKLRIGSVLKWRGFMTKSAAGTLASSFLVKLGTLGTTGDTTILTFALPAGTGVVDTGDFEIIVTCQGPLTSSGILQGGIVVRHNLATTGLMVQQDFVAVATSSAFNVTTASLIATLAFTAGTSQAWTFTQLMAESYNL